MSRFYAQPRRPVSYQAYLAGDLENMVGAETGAEAASSGVGRAVLIGVLTGALTLVVNRWLERLLK